MIVLGIEGTAHTFAVGIIEMTTNGMKILAEDKDVYKPKKGSGIHPTEAADHHRQASAEVLLGALDKSGKTFKDVDLVAYSAGPGLPPCLKATMEFAGKLAKSEKKALLAVNHCIAHIEIGRELTKASDPIVLYVSGGNTQVIGYAAERYRVFGETLDIPIGNAIDVFIRNTVGKYPGGPVMEELAKKGKYVELPYVVKGMDLSFSGIVTAALKRYKENSKLINDLCFSFQENCYAMLTEVTERAMAHTGKVECLLTGGVAASHRLQEMLETMCHERDAEFYVVPKKLAGDNAIMIAYTGWLGYKHGQKLVRRPNFYQKWRTDEVDVLWM